jgi:hypothetical protein
MLKIAEERKELQNKNIKAVFLEDDKLKFNSC